MPQAIMNGKAVGDALLSCQAARRERAGKLVSPRTGRARRGIALARCFHSTFWLSNQNDDTIASHFHRHHSSGEIMPATIFRTSCRWRSDSRLIHFTEFFARPIRIRKYSSAAGNGVMTMRFHPWQLYIYRTIFSAAYDHRRLRGNRPIFEYHGGVDLHSRQNCRRWLSSDVINVTSSTQLDSCLDYSKKCERAGYHGRPAARNFKTPSRLGAAVAVLARLLSASR